MAYALGCTRPQPAPGNYSGRFDWQDGLEEVSLVLDSDAQRSLDLGTGEVRDEIESMVQEQVKRANLRTAKGTMKISILGRSPFLISLQHFEIQVPDFAELRLYVGTQNIDGIRRFIEQNHDVNQRDLPSQSTALFYAAAEADVRPVQALLSLGADPNIPDFEGDTPLIIAVMANRLDVARQLIISGADANHADQAGGTPLMRAVELKRHELVTLLLKSGADPNHIAPNGESALRIAHEIADQATITALQQAGASK